MRKYIQTPHACKSTEEKTRTVTQTENIRRERRDKGPHESTRCALTPEPSKSTEEKTRTLTHTENVKREHAQGEISPPTPSQSQREREKEADRAAEKLARELEGGRHRLIKKLPLSHSLKKKLGGRGYPGPPRHHHTRKTEEKTRTII